MIEYIVYRCTIYDEGPEELIRFFDVQNAIDWAKVNASEMPEYYWIEIKVEGWL